MPTYKFEAHGYCRRGGQGRDRGHQRGRSAAEDQADGLFRHQAHPEGVKGAKGKKKKKTGKSRKTFTIGGVSTKMLCTFTRQFSTLQDAGLPVLRSLQILERQMKPSVLKNAPDRRRR